MPVWETRTSQTNLVKHPKDGQGPPGFVRDLIQVERALAQVPDKQDQLDSAWTTESTVHVESRASATTLRFHVH